MSRLLLASIFIVLTSLTVSAQQQTTDDQQRAAFREALEKIGTGPEKIVTITRRDNTKLKGYIKEIRDDGFDVVSYEQGSTAAPITISYDEVAKVKAEVSIGRVGQSRLHWLEPKRLRL